MQGQFLLLRDRRFLPLFITQFTGAFNDNLFKAALSVMVAYGMVSTGAWKPEVIVSMAAGFLVFPFLVLGPLAGDMADRFDKAVLMRRLKIFELFIIALAFAALVISGVGAGFLLLVLFLFGCQAALFSPAKFSILPQQLETQELIGGNALLNTGTYLAILGGTIGGTLLGVSESGRFVLAVVFIVSGAAGYCASRFIPAALPSAPGLKLKFNALAGIAAIIAYVSKMPRGMLVPIIATSWFYFLGAAALSQFPNFTSRVLHADANVLAMMMVVFSLGVALGGLLNNRILKSEVSAKFVPVAAGGMALFLLDLYLIPARPAGAALMTPGEFLSGFYGWRVMLGLLGLSICGGLYVIPLKSLVQRRAAPERRARVMAASVMLDSLLILLSSVLAALFLGAGGTISQLFLGLAVATFCASLYLSRSGDIK